MFVSPDAAEKRLASKRNRLRAESAAPSVDDILSEVLEEVGYESTEKVEEPEKELELPEKMLDMKEIEKVIEGPRARGKYVGNEPAQIAVGQTSLILGSSMAGRLANLSTPQTQAYQDGLSSTADITTRSLRNPARMKAIEDIKADLAEKAAKRLATTLDVLDEAKLVKVKRATNLSKIAKDMAVIIDKTSGSKAQEGGVHFHVFRPEISVEQSYSVVTVGAAPEDKDSK